MSPSRKKIAPSSPKKASPESWALSGLGLLASAALGQFFLSQAGRPWSFWMGLGFYGLGLYLLFKILPLASKGGRERVVSMPLSWEAAGFLGIALLAAFYRLYHTNQFPDGIFADRAEVALGALRILHGHWRPFLSALDQHVPEVWIYYLAAFWMKLFGPSPLVFSYFDATLSILGVLAFYWVFRLWVPVPTALLAFFFLAVMRWNFVFGHQIYFQCQTVLFMGLALGFLLGALGKNRWPLAALGGLTAAAGLYTYQSFKAFPVLALFYMAYGYFKDRRAFAKVDRSWAVFWLAFTLGAAPLLGWMMDHSGVGRREAEVSVLTKIHMERSPAPLWRNLRDAAFMFNRKGDVNSQSNIPSHRMLDDVTGVFFILGLGYTLRRIKDPPSFYALAGLAVMTLPSILSIDGGHAGRMLGTTPFTALLGALWAAEAWSRGEELFKGRPSLGAALRGTAACLLGAAAFLNFQTYFHDQASNPHCRNDFSWAETALGRLIAGADGRTEFFLPSRFYGHPTVQFLTYPHWGNMHPLDLSRLPLPSSYPPGSSFCFCEDEYKMGALDFLAQCYPGAKVEAYQDYLGHTPLYACLAPAEVLRKLKPGFPRVQKGLYGVYRVQGDERPFLERWDPIVNFTFRDLPLLSVPIAVHWSAQFWARQAGPYSFRLATYDPCRIAVDGGPVSDFAVSPALDAVLKAGWHRLDLDLREGDSPVCPVGLLWKGPGQNQFEFMPNGVLGPVNAKTGPVTSR